jgi:hypothetical protein
MPGPPECGDRQHGIDEIGRQHGSDGKRHHQRRNGERDIGEAHDDGLDPAAEIAGEQPSIVPNGTAVPSTTSASSSEMRMPEDHAGEDVAADIVGAEPVFRRGRQVRARKLTTAPTCSGWGVIEGARIAARMEMITIAAPMTAVGLREKRYQFW